MTRGSSLGFQDGPERGTQEPRLSEPVSDHQRDHPPAGDQKKVSPLPELTAPFPDAGEEEEPDLSELSELPPPPPGYPAPLAQEARHGIAGDILGAIEPHTEADSAALLLTLLTGTGNLIGRGPHVCVEASRHGLNLFSVIVGQSSKSRKGTSEVHIRTLLRRVDANWESTCIQSGLSTGEGLIHRVRDPVEKKEQNRMGQPPTVVDEGVRDKRLLVIESEFAQLLKVMSREGNTISPVIRNAWDGKALQIMTRSQPQIATEAHIGILGHITHDELLRSLAGTEVFNGFANRFLWICARRSRSLPFGGDVPQLEALAERLREIVEGAKKIDRITWSYAAAKIWEAVYCILSEEEQGLYGAVTARAEAQVLRLAITYAVLDVSPVIQPPHLLAALAVWEYSAESAWYLFGKATGDRTADTIEAHLQRAPDGLSRTQIHGLFSGHTSSNQTDLVLKALEQAGRARREKRPGPGRPSEIWFWVDRGVGTRRRSALDVARRLARKLAASPTDGSNATAPAAPAALPAPPKALPPAPAAGENSAKSSESPEASGTRAPAPTAPRRRPARRQQMMAAIPPHGAIAPPRRQCRVLKLWGCPIAMDGPRGWPPSG